MLSVVSGHLLYVQVIFEKMRRMKILLEGLIVAGVVGAVCYVAFGLGGIDKAFEHSLAMAAVGFAARVTVRLLDN